MNSIEILSYKGVMMLLLLMDLLILGDPVIQCILSNQLALSSQYDISSALTALSNILESSPAKGKHLNNFQETSEGTTDGGKLISILSKYHNDSNAFLQI